MKRTFRESSVFYAYMISVPILLALVAVFSIKIKGTQIWGFMSPITFVVVMILVWINGFPKVNKRIELTDQELIFHTYEVKGRFFFKEVTNVISYSEFQYIYLVNTVHCERYLILSSMELKSELLSNIEHAEFSPGYFVIKLTSETESELMQILPEEVLKRIEKPEVV